MKRSTQLVVESAVIGSLLLSVLLGGIAGGLNVPAPWSSIQNPVQVPNQPDLSALAKYYNLTLSWIALGKYSNVSFSLGTFDFVNIPAKVNGSALIANGEISSLNVSIPLAIMQLDNATQLLASKEYPGAIAEIGSGCSEIENASSTLNEFSNTTTPRLSSLGVPTNLYSVGLNMVKTEASNLLTRCEALKAQANNLYPSSGSFFITSPQTSIQTGGYVLIQGNITSNNIGVGAQEVSLFLNGTYIGVAVSDERGLFTTNVSIPFVYKPVVALWAVVAKNSSIGFPGAVSNVLYFTILYNETHIVLKDPPAYLPTQSFTVEGNLSTVSGTGLPNAPVKVTFFNESKYTLTNSDGVFQANLTVPSNASDGIYYVYAAFAPQGVYGPSYNLTAIQVYHETINLVVDAQPVSYAGFGSSLSGSVSANGSALPDANITVSSPWGVLIGKSDSQGSFKFNVPIPIWEFSFAKNVSVSVLPSQPYVSSGRVEARLGLFNWLWIILPGILVCVGAYEINSLDLLPKLWSGRGQTSRKEQIETIVSKTLEMVVPKYSESNKIISVYSVALSLIVSRFGVTFYESSTIREISQQVTEVEGIDIDSAVLFHDISLDMEDYLYSQVFDESRIGDAEQKLAELKRRLK
ncbi:MAG: hypothetical protein JRN20_12885 [Nitrososphaerota archaeon]|nr:hypothetical protein [Nitrososphaerota archaeon]